MLRKTDALVIHRFDYGETSLIARIFTREAGMQSYLIRGARKSRSRNKPLFYQPLTLVSMEVYHKEKGGLQHIRHISLSNPYQSIPYDITKSSQAIFLAEVLMHSLRNQEANHTLFDFLQHAMLYLDHFPGRAAAFHLVFLLQLSRHLGFQPRDNRDRDHRFFSLRDGLYLEAMEHPDHCLDKGLSDLFHQVSTTPVGEQDQVVVEKTERRLLLRRIIDYYRHHVAGMPELKSLPVLESVFAD